MYRRQAASVGCPFPNDDSAPEGLTVWILCSDDGPDQKGAANIMAAAVANNRLHLFIRSKCIFHQLHLIARNLLEFLEGQAESCYFVCVRAVRAVRV